MISQPLEDPEIANLSNGRGTLRNECCDVFRKQRPGYIVGDVPNNLRRHVDDKFVGCCGKAMFVTDLIVHGESSWSVEAVLAAVIRCYRKRHGPDIGKSVGGIELRAKVRMIA